MLVIYNARLYSTGLKTRSVSALAIDYGRIIALGSDAEILDTFSRADRINAEGRAIIPGLTDSHTHLEEYAFFLKKVDCETLSRQECLNRLSGRLVNSAQGEWVLGHGWNQNAWSEGYGTASLLDLIAPHNPVYLTHKSLHSAWANTAALQIAGITRDTPDPLGGKIGRLPGGEPDGILFESAMRLLEAVIPPPTVSQSAKAIAEAIPILWRMGLTGVHDFDGSRCFSALQLLRLGDGPKLRVLKAIHLEDIPHAAEIGLRSGFGDDFLQVGPLKLFSDGALGPQTAAMLSPYEDDPDNRGMLMMDADTVYEHGRLAVDHGFSLAVHAIGDLANRVVLDGYAKLREYEKSLPGLSSPPLHHRIEHVQVIHPDDLPRFAALNIIASMQPIHATSDMQMSDRYWGKRSEYAYAWQSLSSNHARLVFGSDAPVESPNPFWGIHAAVTRRRADGSPSSAGWYPQQCLSVAQAIDAYTHAPAFASGFGNRLGQLAEGYLADLLVLSVDPFICPPEQLRSIIPLAVMVGGDWVYSELD